MKPIHLLAGLFPLLLTACGNPAHPPVPNLVFRGMCDASAGVSAGPGRVLIANDEDNVLRLFEVGTPGPARQDFDLSRLFPGHFSKTEVDLEAAATAPDRVYWISSHGANKKGKARPDRRKIFATRTVVTNDVVSVLPVGTPYTLLLEDLALHPQLKEIDWMKAAATAPKTPGAKNIEALAFSPAGQLWIGFRSPVVAGKALLLPVLNPSEMLDTPATRARLGDPVWLDLGGLGLRDMLWMRDGSRVLLLAGPVDGADGFSLFTWSGSPGEAPVRRDSAALRGLHPEALVEMGDAPSQILVLSDDGSEPIGGLECKLCPAAEQRFKARFLPGLP